MTPLLSILWDSPFQLERFIFFKTRCWAKWFERSWGSKCILFKNIQTQLARHRGHVGSSWFSNHFSMHSKWKQCLHLLPHTTGDSSPGKFEEGAHSSRWVRQIPQTSSWSFHVQFATKWTDLALIWVFGGSDMRIFVVSLCNSFDSLLSFPCCVSV